MVKIYHGSKYVVNNPNLIREKAYNDYGRGFNYTENVETAKELVCKENNDGCVNEYDLEIKGLRVLNLLDDEYSVLNWIAILLNNTFFSL